MLILLGRHDAILRYLEENGINPDSVPCYPENTAHWSDYGKYLDIAKGENLQYIMTQSRELLELFLTHSDMDITLVRCTLKSGKLYTKYIDKEKAWDLAVCREMELR